MDVTISGPTTFTDATRANGIHLFTDVPLGTYTVEVSGLPGGVTCPLTRKTAEIGSPADEAVVDFECESTSSQTALDRTRDARRTA